MRLDNSNSKEITQIISSQQNPKLVGTVAGVKNRTNMRDKTFIKDFSLDEIFGDGTYVKVSTVGEIRNETAAQSSDHLNKDADREIFDILLSSKEINFFIDEKDPFYPYYVQASFTERDNYFFMNLREYELDEDGEIYRSFFIYKNKKFYIENLCYFNLKKKILDLYTQVNSKRTHNSFYEGMPVSELITSDKFSYNIINKALDFILGKKSESVLNYDGSLLEKRESRVYIKTRGNTGNRLDDLELMGA